MGHYDDYSVRLSKQVSARFNEIEAIHNFEYGNETEIALCQLLTSILPDKFGVCRGFVISKEGERAGDDIVIYDKLTFPLIRQHSNNDFSLKQQVPIEAVYVYIECKNSLNDCATLDKAISQVEKVKTLLLKRELKKNPAYEVDGPIYNGKVRDWPRQEPEMLNQPFGIIFARSWDKAAKVEIEIAPNAPDLLILGSDHIATQKVNLGPDGIKGALFFDSKYWCSLEVEKTNNKSYGIGIMMLFQALNKIELQPINWYETLNSEFSPS